MTIHIGGDLYDVLRWQVLSPDVWVEQTSSFRLGFRTPDLGSLVALELACGGPPITVRTSLNEVIDDEVWIDELCASGSPNRAPSVRLPWGRVALVEAARSGLAGQIRPEVIDLDRALALDRLGVRDQAIALAATRKNTVIEVVELLHDAGMADATTGSDLVRLLGLIAQSALALDLQSVRDHVGQRDDAIDNIFRSILTSQTPPAVWNAVENLVPSNEVLLSAWRTRRRIRAARCVLTAQQQGDGSTQARELLAEPLSTARTEAGAQVIELALGPEAVERADEREPLMSELLYCLLCVRPELERSLEAAAYRDDAIAHSGRLGG